MFITTLINGSLEFGGVTKKWKDTGFKKLVSSWVEYYLNHESTFQQVC